VKSVGRLRTRCFCMKQFADDYIEKIGAREKWERRLFPHAEELHFLFELHIAPVIFQPLLEVLESIFFLARDKEGPAEIEVEYRIDLFRGLGIRGLEQDEGLTASGQTALVFFVHYCLEPAVIGENIGMVWIGDISREQDAVSLLTAAAPKLNECLLEICGSRHSIGLVLLFC